jgi:hypothetical protein
MIWISFLGNELGCSTEPGKGLVWNPQDLSYIRLDTVCLPDKMRKLVSFEAKPHLCYSFTSKIKTNTKKGDRNEGYHL